MKPLSVEDGTKMTEPDVYLGGGLYAGYDGYQVKIYSHNGVHATNSVFLEPEVVRDFLEYVKKIEVIESQSLQVEKNEITVGTRARYEDNQKLKTEYAALVMKGRTDEH